MGTDVLTFGQKAVGVSFNPSQNETVAKVKQQYADIIDNIEQYY